MGLYGAFLDKFPNSLTVTCWNCLLPQQKPDDIIRIGLDLSELDITASEKKATYEEIQSYVLEHSGIKVSHLYIAQVKQKYGIIERENYNKPKSEYSKQPQCPPEKEAAITEALTYFKMIWWGECQQPVWTPVGRLIQRPCKSGIALAWSFFFSLRTVSSANIKLLNLKRLFTGVRQYAQIETQWNIYLQSAGRFYFS